MLEFRTGGTNVLETRVGNVVQYLAEGVKIYCIEVESFPNHVTNMYLVLDGAATFIDVGFNGPQSQKDLARGFDIINTSFGDGVDLADVANIVITHGHGDHFGMLEYGKLKGRRVFIHPLDSWVIRDYSGTYQNWKRNMRELLFEAGCGRDLDQIFPVEQLDYHISEYDLVEVVDGQQIINGYEVYHTPGHSLGEICLRVGPLMFLGDHMLSITTPHQVPTSGWQGAGLMNYLHSLRKVAASGVDLGLAAHENAIYPVSARAREIEHFHMRRLEEIRDLCRFAMTLYQVTDEYYRGHPELIQASSLDDLPVDDVLLALEEIKAHLEYLVDEGRLCVTHVDSGVPRYLAI